MAGEHEAQEHQAPDVGPPIESGRAGWSPPDLTHAAAGSVVRALVAGDSHALPRVPPAALIALQRSAGNAAVHRALMRDPKPGATKTPPAAGPMLPSGVSYEWQRRGTTYWILVRKQFLLDRKVPADATGIADVALIKEMITGIGKAAPWADIALLHKNIAAFTPVTFGKKLSDEPEILLIPLADLPMKFIGNPPGEDFMVRVRKDEVLIYVDVGLVRRYVKTPKATEIANPSFNAQIYGALEAAVQMQMGAGREPGWRTKVYESEVWRLPAPADQLDRSVLLVLHKPDILNLFGPGFEDKVAAMAGGKEAGRVQGATINLPPALEKDWPKIMAVLQELLGAPDGKKKKDSEPQRSVSEKEAQLLLKIAASPLKAQIMAQLKGKGADAIASGMTFSEILENAVAQAELKSARERLKRDEPDTSGEEPILKRPVHGDIVLTTGRPVPHKESVFTFKVRDEVDALRVTFIQIQWFAYETGKSPVPYLERELNKYIPSRGQGPINDQLFEVTFPKPGTYTIEALVNHSFYLPAPFKIDVKVLSEADETAFQEKTALAGFATDKDAKTSKHDFDVGGITSAVTDYEEGTITRGKLDPKFTPGTLADRMKAIDAEIDRVDKLYKAYEAKPIPSAKAVLNWAFDYLKTLREGRDKISKEAQGARLIPCTGVYVSRSKKAPSAPLDLVCLQTRTSDGGYKVVLHDLTQVYEAENYRYEAENKTAEGAYEEVFVEHAESYPDGTLSVAFQGWNEKKQEPTQSFVKFRKVTDTIGKDVKTNVFDPAVNIAVNLAAAVMLVVPGLQGAGFAIALVWNTSQTLMDLEEKAAKGTLKDKDYVYAAASFALDLIPLAGRSARMISIGKRAFYAIELVQTTGQVLLIAAQGMDEIEQLRNGVISKLAKLNEEIEAISINNQADPRLDDLREQQERLIKEGEEAVWGTYSRLVGQQALMVVAGTVVQQAAIKKFTVRVTTLESEGKFAHIKGEKTPHYDYTQRKMVGDREAMTQAEFDRVERHAQISETLEKNVADPATRKKIVETLADEPVDVEVGGKKTRLEVEGDRQVLKVGENAKPDEILAEALRAKTGKAVKPDPKTPVEKAAYHRNELEHLAELKKMAAGEPRIDDFDVARKMKGQFDELKRTVEKMPPGKERAEMEAFLKSYEKGVLEPATKVVDKVRAAGGSNGLDQFANLKPEQRAIVADLKDEGMRKFFKLPQEKQRKLFGMTPDTIKQIHANDGPRQARLLDDIDAMTRAAAQDVNYDITTGAGAVRHKEGHPFDEHGHHNTDATMFARAAAESTSKGRWESFDTQVREIEHFRRQLMDPAVPPGSPQSPINAAGAAAINNGTVTREAIMNDPLAHDQYLKAQVDFRAQPSSNNRPVGEAFHPDGTTRRPASRVTVIFQLDNAGNWQVLTGFPVE